MLRLRIQTPIFRSAKETVSGINARGSLSGINHNRAALIVSQSLNGSEEVDHICKLLRVSEVKVFVKSWTGEPSLDSLTGTLLEVENFKPDLIIALGGGSVIDGCKIIWMMYENPFLNTQELISSSQNFPLRSYAEFCAIPCTIGSGSEVSSSAVISDPDTKTKIPIVNHGFIPDLVIVDPYFLKNVPRDILLSTLADALSHALEGLSSKIYHPLMSNFAEMSVRLILNNWTTLLDSELNDDCLVELQQAALLAGYVQNHCLVGLSHAIAHQLGEFKISHSIANALLMPHTLVFNREDEACDEKITKLEKSVGMKGKISSLFEEIASNLSVVPKLHFSPNEIDTISSNALLDMSARVNPRSFDKGDVIEILSKISGK